LIPVACPRKDKGNTEYVYYHFFFAKCVLPLYCYSGSLPFSCRGNIRTNKSSHVTMMSCLRALCVHPASSVFVNKAYGDHACRYRLYARSPRSSSPRATRGNRRGGAACAGSWRGREGARSGHSALVRSGRAARRPQLLTRGLGRAAADAPAQAQAYPSHCFPPPHLLAEVKTCHNQDATHRNTLTIVVSSNWNNVGNRGNRQSRAEARLLEPELATVC
jgi:hypothetical protein